MLASEVIKRFEEYCPEKLAISGDPVGLHIGTLNKEIKTVMTTLDVRPEVVCEAISKEVDLLIAKHPPIFRPAKRLDTDNPQNKMYADLLKHDINVYAAHTNIDIVEDGLNDWFCELLGIANPEFLEKTHEINGKFYGIGRIGKLQEKLSLVDFTEKVKEVFTLDSCRVIAEDFEKTIETVAICGGSGEKFYPSALEKGADLYITGDIYYHTAHDMLANGLSAIDPGHHIEVLFTEKIAEKLQTWNVENNWQLTILKSEVDTNPFKVR
ncbi:dinuclear metal center protein, YbgI/SA1388 family [Pilibacter termitis]|uniref:GTP cyclohydrolase 1 type 2 homolog n=1 Tax=Pilibacter termitis TaxID=263852 RepID=A0A1T4NKZ9_9ENTE|nr:Nif3-like dinuclear metal center hexameric protein [Pilibacter termitis]SJZ79961.1 dinuclear metal center protein, YbgI/SA1388 family [Pilibacter termitis]